MLTLVGGGDLDAEAGGALRHHGVGAAGRVVADAAVNMWFRRLDASAKRTATNRRIALSRNLFLRL